jgi:hypothetical protein
VTSNVLRLRIDKNERLGLPMAHNMLGRDEEASISQTHVGIMRGLGHNPFREMSTTRSSFLS